MFVTFYSYKGGVGRTMALANIACLLAEDREHPQRVLLWDFDLEAPGLHKLFPATEPVVRGFVDMAFEFAETNVMPDLQEYVYKSSVKGIDILPAGRVDQSYCDKLGRLNWMGFFADDPTDKGPFFSSLTAWMAEETEALGKRYDYILIDSRTGLNDVAGICTQVLPDLVLFIFRLTDQNIDGIEHLAPAIHSQLGKRKKEDVAILPVASVVVSQSSDDLYKRRQKVMTLFDCKGLDYIRFDADLVSDEKLFCRDEVKRKLWPTSPIIDDYDRLSQAVRRRNPLDTKIASQRLDKYMMSADFASARILLERLLKRRPEAPKSWAHLQTLFLHQPSKDGVRFADSLVNSVLQESSSNIFALEWKASEFAAKAKLGDEKALIDARRYLDSALEYAGERDRLRLHRKLSEIASVTGELDVATKELKECHSLAPANIQIKLDLAKLYVRRGRDYFAMAAELFEDHPQKALDAVIVYLWTFLGDESKAEKCFSNCRKHSLRFESEQYIQLVSAHRLLMRNELDKAMEIAEGSLRNSVESADIANWGEFFLCARDYRRAAATFECLMPTQPASTDDFEYGGHMTLAKFLAEDPETSIQDVLDDWKHENWSFTELLFFRERVKASDSSSSNQERLNVIERLIQKCELISHVPRGDVSVFWRRQ